jgi:PAS domain-containing protein
MSLKTVKVPEGFEPLFEKAESAVAAYFDGLRRDPERGTIEIAGERYVLVRAAAMSVEFFGLVRELFGRGRKKEADGFSRNLLFDLAHAIGRSDARCFHARMGLNDPVERLSAGPIHFAHTGWASVDILPESNPSPDQDYYLIYDHPYSFEANAWLESRSLSAFPVCIMNAGYSSGWCEESFGVPLVATEVLCRGRGDDCCRFIMAPPERIEKRVERYMEALKSKHHSHKPYVIPGLFERKRMEEALRASEAWFRQVFDHMPSAVAIYKAVDNGEDFVFTDFNQAA